MSPRQVCVCGCGARAVHLHHAVYAQELGRVAGRDKARATALKRDARNLVPVALACHGAHHSRQRPLPIRRLPDSVFEFAADVLGAGPAWSYIERRYAGDDPRMAALIEREQPEEDLAVLSEAALTPAPRKLIRSVSLRLRVTPTTRSGTTASASTEETT